MPTYASMFPGLPGLSSPRTSEEEEQEHSLVPPTAVAPVAPAAPAFEVPAFENMALPDELAMGKNFSRGLVAGVDQTQAMLYGAVGLAGNALGLEGMEAWGKEGYQRNVAEAAQSAPAAGESGSSFVEADSFTDYANWAARTFGEQIPNLAAMFTGAGIGGVAARGALGGLAARGAMGLADSGVKSGAARLAAKEFLATGAAVRLPTEAAKKAAEGYLRAGAVGQQVGGLAASTAMTGGGMYGDQVEEGLTPRASQIAGPALAAGALDWVVPGALSALKFGQAARGVLPAAGRVLGAVGTEGGTEVGQGIIERATLEDAKGTLRTPEGLAKVFDRDAMVEEFAAGALLGGGFGAVREGGELLARRTDELPDGRTEQEEQPQPIQPQPCAPRCCSHSLRRSAFSVSVVMPLMSRNSPAIWALSQSAHSARNASSAGEKPSFMPLLPKSAVPPVRGGSRLYPASSGSNGRA